ncbi:MAG: DUF485 domain-containing protein [Desulfuromonadales bacterium]|jgi:uncharacterized membrane protein (DUF485 family)
MGHGPAVKLGVDNATQYKSRIGIGMFLVYLVCYVIFVAINTISPTLMEIDVLGQNMAVVFGFGLIFFALVLAVIYNHLCTAAENRLNK